MKTIKEWLSELPEPYKTEAIEEAERLSPDTLNHITDSLSDTVLKMFCWADSRQGEDYWDNVYLHHLQLDQESADKRQ